MRVLLQKACLRFYKMFFIPFVIMRWIFFSLPSLGTVNYVELIKLLKPQDFIEAFAPWETAVAVVVVFPIITIVVYD